MRKLLITLGLFSVVPAVFATTTTTATGVVFTQINNAPVVAKDTTASFHIVADVNSSTDANPIALTITTGGTDIKGTNGNTINVAGVNVSTNNHAIAQNTASFVMSANPSKSLTTSALRFTVTAAGKTSITLTGLSMTNALAGYTGTMLVSIYKTSIAAGNLAGQKALSNGTPDIIPMTSNSNLNSVIDAGSTVEYIVAIEGALVNSSSTSSDWNVSLTNANFGGISASTYNNIGAFPFTSTK